MWKGFLCNKSPHDFKRDPVSCITCELWTAQLDHSRVWPPSTVLDSLDHSDHALILILFFEPRSWYFNHQKASRHYVPCMSMLMPRAMCSVTHSEHQLAILAESNSLEGAKRWLFHAKTWRRTFVRQGADAWIWVHGIRCLSRNLTFTCDSWIRKCCRRLPGLCNCQSRGRPISACFKSLKSLVTWSTHSAHLEELSGLKWTCHWTGTQPED